MKLMLCLLFIASSCLAEDEPRDMSLHSDMAGDSISTLSAQEEFDDYSNPAYQDSLEHHDDDLNEEE